MRAGIRARLLSTRLLAAAMAVLVLFSASHWKLHGPTVVAQALFAVGAALVLAGFGGRVWALRHIAGRKKRQLVCSGPYAMCRHPLYLSSFVGGLGLVMCTGRLSLVLFYLAASWLVVPAALRTEEAFLEERFPDYSAYRAEVPALLPRRGGTRRRGREERAPRQIDRHVIRHAALETATFLSPLLLFALVEHSQAVGALPVLFVLP
jgi:protein-S-isoprenylcysteine O-methyltransferase Ste14